MTTRILHFAQDGDTSGFFPQLARWHDRSRYRMYFGTLGPIAPWLKEFMAGQDVPCLSCACPRRFMYPLALARLVRFLRAEKIDLIHVHLFDPSIVGLVAATLARTRFRVMTRHYSDYHTRVNKRWHVRLDQFCTSRCQRVIAVSEHTAEGMRTDEKAPADRLRVIHNGIDFARMKLSSAEAPEQIRREFLPNGGTLLLQVARLHPEKGHEFLFKALPNVIAQAGRPVRLLVAGAGQFESEYRRQVRELRLEDTVVFTGFRRDIADLIAAADVMVLPSVAEAFGLALTEAIYLGTPIVATRVGGIPEVVRDGIDGLLVPPASPEALSKAILRLIQEPLLRHSLAREGRAWISERFQFETMVRRYEAVYQELLDPSPISQPASRAEGSTVA
jgi:glycosyltransferase involved in cell wall biosynthesis